MVVSGTCTGLHEVRNCVQECNEKRTCLNRFKQINCAMTKRCVFDCVCKPGYLKNADGNCVPEDDCG